MKPETKELWRKVTNACRHLNIKTIEVEFDGAGDSGQVESVQFLDADSKSVTPALTLGECRIIRGHVLENGVWRDNVETHNLSIEDGVEQIVYDLLEQDYAGWEINEGAYGNFYFDIDERNIKCEFNQRIESTEYSENEFNLDDTTEES